MEVCYSVNVTVNVVRMFLNVSSIVNDVRRIRYFAAIIYGGNPFYRVTILRETNYYRIRSVELREFQKLQSSTVTAVTKRVGKTQFVSSTFRYEYEPTAE